MPGELHHGIGQQCQRPTRPARRRAGARGRHQKRLFLAGELALRARARLLAQGRFHIAFDKPALGPINRRSADADSPGDILITHPLIGRQENLRALDLARGVLAALQQVAQLLALRLAQFDSVTYIHRRPHKVEGTTDESHAGLFGESEMSQIPLTRPTPSPRFTPKQGQYLAFIHAYTLVLGRPPAEADLQRYFCVTPPSVHQMVLTLERAGLINRQPRAARSIKVLVDPQALPPLQPTIDQLVKSSVHRC